MAVYRALPVLLFMLCVAGPVRAEVFLVDGPHGCLAIHGEWEASATCAVRHVVVGPEDRVVVADTVSFVTSGPLFNYGRLEVYGTFYPHGGVTNRGTMIIAGLTVNGDVFTNEATLINRGWFHNHAGVENRAVFNNEGWLDTCGGPIVNYGFMRSTGDIDNWGASIVNHGILVNEGRAYNPDADSYLIHNTGAIENVGTLENGGTLRNACGAALYGEGTLSGVAPVYDLCDPADALQLLITRVLDSGQFALGRLAKKDVNLLFGHLARAAKQLAANDRAGAAASVELFSTEVQAIEADGRIMKPLAAAYVGWAARLKELLSS